ncbi:MAG: barstar family protein [Micropruina sp.]
MQHDSPAASDPTERQLIRDPYITMFWDPALLDDTVGRLHSRGYDVRTTDAAAWTDQYAMHRALASLLDFPGYYGNNLDALNDCLSDVAGGGYGPDASSTGLVLVLVHFDRFAAAHAEVAFALLDIFAVQARDAALWRHPMVCLVQSDDPELSIPPVGARPVMWNGAEWLRSRRGGERTEA